MTARLNYDIQARVSNGLRLTAAASSCQTVENLFHRICAAFTVARLID